MPKQFSYQNASVEQIAHHFLASSRQVVSFARNYYKDDIDMWPIINEAYKMYVIMKIDRKNEAA